MVTTSQNDDTASNTPATIVDNPKKRNFKRFWKKLNKHFKLFARTTTLECFKYIADNKTVIVEK